MARRGRYDSTLQMFVQETRELDMSRLVFLRWLGEQGRLEHEIAGPSCGPLALRSRLNALERRKATSAA